MSDGAEADLRYGGLLAHRRPARRGGAGLRDEVAWANTYRVVIQYTPTATRCGNAVYSWHRTPMSRLTRALAGVPGVRAAAFRQSAAEVGVEGLAAVATSTTTQTTMAGLPFNGLDGIAPTGRGLLCDAQKGFAFVVDCTRAKEFALAHWLVNGADGGRLFVRCFSGDATRIMGAVASVVPPMRRGRTEVSETQGASAPHTARSGATGAPSSASIRPVRRRRPLLPRRRL